MFEDLQHLSISETNNLSPIVLAFVGDAVYSLYVREKLALSNDSKTGKLNKFTVEKVNAKAQAEKIQELFPILTDEEILIFKRARNAKKPSKSKTASTVEYNMSTGFEALIGFLYLTDNFSRLNTILNYEKGKEQQ